MGHISEEICEVISQLKISASIIDENNSLAIKKRLAEKFSTNKEKPCILSWQNLVNTESYHDSDAWKLLKEYIGNEEVLLFVNPEDEQTMWKFDNGIDLEFLLSESTGFPFCITSKKANYILCFEDHNCLIGVGEAASWVKKQREKKAKS